MKNEYDTDVLVIGAGPTGLTAATELVRHGVDALVVDRNAEGVRNSRALTVHARTLELLRNRGISDELVRSGYPSPGINISVDSRNPAIVEMFSLDTRYPFVLIISQAQTEEILEAELTRLGGAVERSTTVVRVDQDSDSVTAYCRDAKGMERRIRARYLIDCGGAHSVSLKHLQVPSHGGRFEGVAMLADVRYDGELTKGFITNYASDRGVCLILPFKDDYIRVIALDFTKQDALASEPLKLADLQETVNAIAPIRLHLRDPRWLSHFHAPHRVVDRYRTGRIFLAGDAAHLFIPAGGQGMNTGIQDALNLAWKLALVIRGATDATLLDTYHVERHAVAEQTLKASDTLFRIFLNQAQHRVVRAVAPPLLRRLVARSAIRHRAAATLSQIGVNYRNETPPRGQRDRTRARRALRAGDRLPDAEIVTTENPEGHLHDLLAHSGYTVFGYASPLQSSASQHSVAARLASIIHQYDAVSRSVLVRSEGLADDGDMPVVVDIKRQVRRRVGMTPGSVLVARPDGYVAFHAHVSGNAAADAATFASLMDSWSRPARRTVR